MLGACSCSKDWSGDSCDEFDGSYSIGVLLGTVAAFGQTVEEAGQDCAFDMEELLYERTRLGRAFDSVSGDGVDRIVSCGAIDKFELVASGSEDSRSKKFFKRSGGLFGFGKGGGKGRFKSGFKGGKVPLSVGIVTNVEQAVSPYCREQIAQAANEVARKLKNVKEASHLQDSVFILEDGDCQEFIVEDMLKDATR